MFALIAAILFFLLAIGVGEDAAIDLTFLALAFWALHFAYATWPWSLPPRRRQQT